MLAWNQTHSLMVQYFLWICPKCWERTNNVFTSRQCEWSFSTVVISVSSLETWEYFEKEKSYARMRPRYEFAADVHNETWFSVGQVKHPSSEWKQSYPPMHHVKHFYTLAIMFCFDPSSCPALFWQRISVSYEPWTYLFMNIYKISLEVLKSTRSFCVFALIKRCSSNYELQWC